MLLETLEMYAWKMIDQKLIFDALRAYSGKLERENCKEYQFIPPLQKVMRKVALSRKITAGYRDTFARWRMDL